jgi:hypothetical protein
MSTAINSTVALEALKVSEPFKQLRPAQRNWVLTLIETGDENIATQRAYPKASPHGAACMRYQIRRSKSVKAALAFWNTDRSHEVVDLLKIENLQLKDENQAAVARIAAEADKVKRLDVENQERAEKIDSARDSLEQIETENRRLAAENHAMEAEFAQVEALLPIVIQRLAPTPSPRRIALKDSTLDVQIGGFTVRIPKFAEVSA